jgi:hypothetical protein
MFISNIIILFHFWEERVFLNTDSDALNLSIIPSTLCISVPFVLVDVCVCVCVCVCTFIYLCVCLSVYRVEMSMMCLYNRFHASD